jgi:hypothetical protein
MSFRSSRLRPLVATGTAAVALGLFAAPGTAQAAPTTLGDPACLSEEYVPASGVALSRQDAADNRTLHAFGTGTDSQVWTRQLGANASAGWTSLGGVSTYGPAAVFSGSTQHVLVVGGDGAVWTRSNPGVGWGPWTSIGGYFVSSPAAASLGTGHLRVFGTGADGALWTNEFAGGRWSGWYSLGGRLLTAPAATTYRAVGQVEVSVMGTDGLVWTMGLSQGARSGTWINRNFAACSVLASPSMSTKAFPEERVYLDSTWAAVVSGSGTYVRSMGGAFLTDPDVEYDGSLHGNTVKIGVGEDGAMWVNYTIYDYGWTSLGGQFF